MQTAQETSPIVILVNLQRAEVFGPGQNRSRSGQFEVPRALFIAAFSFQLA